MSLTTEQTPSQIDESGAMTEPPESETAGILKERADVGQAAWLDLEASRLASAIVRQDKEHLLARTRRLEELRAAHLVESRLGRDPWSDPRVRYGALLALGVLAETASRTVIDPQTLKFVFGLSRRSEQLRVLEALFEHPQQGDYLGRLAQSTGVGKTNLQPALGELVERGLVNRSTDAEDGRKRCYELTRQGQAVMQLVACW